MDSRGVLTGIPRMWRVTLICGHQRTDQQENVMQSTINPKVLHVHRQTSFGVVAAVAVTATERHEQPRPRRRRRRLKSIWRLS